MAVFSLFKSNGPTGLGYNSTAEEVTEGLSLTGKTILSKKGSGSNFNPNFNQQLIFRPLIRIS
jgi:hypothetical protein